MVNTVCLGFSHECSEFSQSSYFLEFRVKKCVQDKIFGIFYVLCTLMTEMQTECLHTSHNTFYQASVCFILLFISGHHFSLAAHIYWRIFLS